jgi:hypothetical protein
MVTRAFSPGYLIAGFQPLNEQAPQTAGLRTAGELGIDQRFGAAERVTSSR